jgi:hypothetical protein
MSLALMALSACSGHAQQSHNSSVTLKLGEVAPRVHTKIVVYLLVGVMFYLSGHLILHLLRGWL